MAVRGWMTRSYRLIDHDPEIDKFKTLWREEHIKETDLAVLAGLSAQTVHRMFGNETKRPQHATFAKMAAAMGYEYGLQRETHPDYNKEIPKAREEFKAHKKALEKKRAKKPNGKQKGG